LAWSHLLLVGDPAEPAMTFITTSAEPNRNEFCGASAGEIARLAGLTLASLGFTAQTQLAVGRVIGQLSHNGQLFGSDKKWDVSLLSAQQPQFPKHFLEILR
jgi:hypothetical protein